MSSQTNKDLWQPWHELWNGNLALVDEIIAPTFVAHFAPAGTSPAEVRGPAGLKQWIGESLAALTDSSFTITVGPLADEDLVAMRWVFRATYQGGMPGASSTAVGKRVEYARSIRGGENRWEDLRTKRYATSPHFCSERWHISSASIF